MNLEEKFAIALQEQSKKAETAGIPVSKRLLQNAAQHGAVEAVREQLRRNRVSDNFDALAVRKMLKWSAEALVVSKEFGALFSDEEADFCLAELLNAGYFG